MPLTLTSARSEILTLIKNAADGISMDVQWDGVPSDRTQDGTAAWVRAGITHSDRRQASLAGSNGNRIFTSSGLLIVNLYTPLEGGLAQADSLATVFRNAVEGVSTPGGVWFRNVRTVEIGLDANWWRTDILADFIWDEYR